MFPPLAPFFLPRVGGGGSERWPASSNARIPAPPDRSAKLCVAIERETAATTPAPSPIEEGVIVVST